MMCAYTLTPSRIWKNKLTTKKSLEGGKVGLKISKNKAKHDNSRRQVNLTAGNH
jgi:hypothetical protein